MNLTDLIVLNDLMEQHGPLNFLSQTMYAFMRRSVPHPQLLCPWVSCAPPTGSGPTKGCTGNSTILPVQTEPLKLTTTAASKPQSVNAKIENKQYCSSGVSDKITITARINEAMSAPNEQKKATRKRKSTQAAETSNESSQSTAPENLPEGPSTQYQNFMRLVALFPDLHPATIHGALGLCHNDFIRTIDSLLYALQYRSYLDAKRKGFPQTPTPRYYGAQHSTYVNANYNGGVPTNAPNTNLYSYPSGNPHLTYGVNITIPNTAATPQSQQPLLHHQQQQYYNLNGINRTSYVNNIPPADVAPNPISNEYSGISSALQFPTLAETSTGDVKNESLLANPMSQESRLDGGSMTQTSDGSPDVFLTPKNVSRRKKRTVTAKFNKSQFCGTAASSIDTYLVPDTDSESVNLSITSETLPTFTSSFTPWTTSSTAYVSPTTAIISPMVSPMSYINSFTTAAMIPQEQNVNRSDAETAEPEKKKRNGCPLGDQCCNQIFSDA